MKKSRPKRGKPYSLIEHTADTGVRVSGGSLSELFENAAAGLREMMFGAGRAARGSESCMKRTRRGCSLPGWGFLYLNLSLKASFRPDVK